MDDNKKYKIIFEKDKCIGAAACNSVSDSWKYNDKEGKSDLIGAKFNNTGNTYELEIEEKSFDRDYNAARLCPVKAIHIEEIKSKKILI